MTISLPLYFYVHFLHFECMIDNSQKINRIVLNISLEINLFTFIQTNYKIKTQV